MKQGGAPFVRTYDLGDLGRAGDRIAVALKESDRKRLAEWAEIESVVAFEATVELKRISANRFGYHARLSSDIVQSCVVTLEPVRSHIEREFSRELHLVDHGRHEGEAMTLAAADDEAPEDIESRDFDLAGPLLEEFSLAIEPYPRAPGVTFESPAEEVAAESPFAALRSLKTRG